MNKSILYIFVHFKPNGGDKKRKRCRGPGQSTNLGKSGIVAGILIQRSSYQAKLDELEKDKKLSLILVNDQGEKLEAFFEDRVQIKGFHKFKFLIEILNLPKGDYELQLIDEAQVLRSLKVSF